MKRIFTILLACIVLATTIPTAVFAGTNLSSSHAKAVTKLTDACGYYGWCTSEENTDSSSKTIVTSFKGTTLYSNVTYGANFKVKTVKAKKNKKVKYTSTYYVGNKKYSLSSIKSMLKNYSSDVGRASTVKKSTIDISDEIIALAKKYNWQAQVIDRIEKTDKYAITIEFENDSYIFKAEITTARSSDKKLVITYTRKGKKSNRASIEDWLKTYAVY